ncbi:demethylmenaquinone methyltransferase [Aplysia californica]|uniref:Demethylmenaquinone methyltransferase n=1 Tax=Aplysia californica TaxID=6500 RepID=A0ABM0JV58_APLCA|nr:demethylmenaquinone methyltransferase [Aplysia californica]
MSEGAATTSTLSREQAVAAVKAYIRPCQTPLSLAKVYDDTAQQYDQYMHVLGLNGPQRMVRKVEELLGDNFGAKIIDVGAGSGLAGMELFEAGYKNLDAVDASQGLLKVAEKKGCYKNRICQFVGQQPLPINNDTYDVAVLCGAMGESHIPKIGLRDIIRIVKPGGYIVNVFREEALRVPYYGDGLEPYMRQLEQEGLWKEHARHVFPKNIDNVEGLMLVHRIM